MSQGKLQTMIIQNLLGWGGGGGVKEVYYGICASREWADSVSPRTNTIASRDQFKPIRIGENLVVNYNG